MPHKECGLTKTNTTTTANITRKLAKTYTHSKITRIECRNCKEPKYLEHKEPNVFRDATMAATIQFSYP